MRSAVAVLAGVVLLAGCASSSTMSSGPDVKVHLDQVAGPPDIYYFAGPVNIQYRVAIENPTDEPVTLTRLDLQTLGPGAYSLRTESTPMTLKVPPKSTANLPDFRLGAGKRRVFERRRARYAPGNGLFPERFDEEGVREAVYRKHRTVLISLVARDLHVIRE